MRSPWPPRCRRRRSTPRRPALLQVRAFESPAPGSSLGTRTEKGTLSIRVGVDELAFSLFSRIALRSPVYSCARIGQGRRNERRSPPARRHDAVDRIAAEVPPRRRPARARLRTQGISSPILRLHSTRAAYLSWGLGEDLECRRRRAGRRGSSKIA